MSTRRIRSIDQIIPSIVEHDAVSNHTFAAQALLHSMGFESEIYAGNIGPGTEGRVQPLSNLAKVSDGSQAVLYQCSIGSPAAEVFAGYPGPKLLDYHNITPAELVEKWLPALGAEARLGRRQLRELAPVVPYAFADSAFNAAELDTVGFAVTRVVPVLVDAGNLTAEASNATLERIRRNKEDGGVDWLFVGQIGAHKAQHDVIKAFACYRQVFDGKARLYLVGREMGAAYKAALVSFVDDLGLSDVVNLPGSVSASELAAYYEACDVFVCCSDHEGFCVPIVEAMARALPIVAFAAAAVPGTLGDAGILLADKSPLIVASTVHALLGDDPFCRAMLDRAKVRSSQFSLHAAEQAFCSAIEEALDYL